ncbi:MAG: asparagine synthase (glutamine-hydrolyzing) [Bacteroidia bacterium]|nr:asparagine synthase (glutamine-hydrolyzing) [Bacteroidia bacterium]
MCGIFGYLGNQAIDIKRCTDIIYHRGPDSEGFLSYDFSKNKKFVTGQDAIDFGKSENFKLIFGFRRLAIIDLSQEANQPFIDASNHYSIIFNGEIYNHIELRKELEELGHSFQTNSDTEVLLKSYMAWDKDCVNKFNGMWSFSILDLQKNIIFCSRDRFGVKPFYYYSEENKFIFSSEIKQMFEADVPKQINENIVRDFLQKNIVNHNSETFFKDIFQLSPGHNIVIDISSPIITYKITRFWHLNSNIEYKNLTFEEACKEFKKIFINSIKLRFRSDVPIGSCLSGGLDSSSIVCAAVKEMNHEIHTFSAVFKKYKKYDESFYIELIKKKYPEIITHFITFNEESIINELEKVVWHQDEPFGSFSIFAQFLVMQSSSKEGVKVLLDGQGGDEILFGYRKYQAFYIKELLKRGKLLKSIKIILNLLSHKEFNFFSIEGFKRYLGLNESFNFLTNKCKNIPLSSSIGLRSSKSLKAKSKEDIEKYSYPPLLRYEDRNSMAFSIETRVPFMDYKLVTFLHSLPSDFIINKGFTKYILRESLKEYLPFKIKNRISKLGFATPQNEWIKEKLFPIMKEHFFKMKNPYLLNMKIYEDFLVYPKSKLYSEDFSRFYIFDKWYQSHFSENKI